MQTVQTSDNASPAAATTAQLVNTTAIDPPKKSNKAKAALIGIGVVAVGVCGYYFLLPLIKRKNDSSGMTPPPTPSNNSTTTNTYVAPAPATPSKPVTPPRNDNFPLKAGSKGPNVTLLQNALIAKYGSGILPKYGADGDYGGETIAALKSKGLPTSIDQATFISLTQETKVDTKGLADVIATAITIGGFAQVLPLLKKIKTAQQYKEVSDKFKEIRVGFVRYQSLLSAMFRLYTESSQQSQLRQVFTSMGLVYKPDEDTWKLPDNLSGFNLITTQVTHVWPDAKTAIQVPPNMVLGQEVERKGNFIAFEAQGRILLVPAAHVRYS